MRIKRAGLAAATACGLCFAASQPAVAVEYVYVYYTPTPYITEYDQYRRIKKPRPSPPKAPRKEVSRKPAAAIHKPAAAIRKPAATVHEPAAAIDPHGKENPGALSIFLRDFTLRRGDVVMTTSGLAVFEGDGLDHKASDFVPLAKAKWIARRAELISLQNASLHAVNSGTVRHAEARASNPHLKNSYAEKAQTVRRIPGVPGFPQAE
jgi:hypothetical protein